MSPSKNSNASSLGAWCFELCFDKDEYFTKFIR